MAPNLLDSETPGIGKPKLTGLVRATDLPAQPGFVQPARRRRCSGERVEKPEGVRGALERALRANEAGQPAVLVSGMDGRHMDGFHAY